MKRKQNEAPAEDLALASSEAGVPSVDAAPQSMIHEVEDGRVITDIQDTVEGEGVDINTYDPSDLANAFGPDVTDGLFAQMPNAIPSQHYAGETRHEGGGDPYPMFEPPQQENV